MWRCAPASRCCSPASISTKASCSWCPAQAGSPCLRCVWPEATRDGLVGNCAEAGVLGPVPGVFGSLQALEALKYLLGLPGLAANEMLIFDLVTLSTQRLRARRARGLRGASARRRTGREPTRVRTWNRSSARWRKRRPPGSRVVDVRDSQERLAEPLAVASLHLPMSKLLAQAASLDLGTRYLLVCATGKRSGAAADLLRSQGFRECRRLRGGLKGLKTIA